MPRHPISHRQLQHGRSLPLAELRHEHMGAIWKFDRIMVTMRNIGLDRAEFAHPEIQGFRPKPSVVVFYILGERKFCPRGMQTATAGSRSEAKPRVEVPRNVVVMSVSPTRAGASLRRADYSHTSDCSSFEIATSAPRRRRPLSEWTVVYQFLPRCRQLCGSTRRT